MCHAFGIDNPDGTSYGVVRNALDALAEARRCLECGLCAEACGEAGQQQHVIGFAGRGSGRVPVTVFDRPLADTNCTMAVMLAAVS